MLIQNIDPVFFTLGPLEIRYYGVMFALGALLYYILTEWVFRREKFPVKDFESVAVYLFFGLIIGARFGHVIFYNLNYFWAHPADVFKVWEGGLSSHGAAIGVFLAYFLFCRVKKIRFSKYVDALVLVMPLVAGFVRIGNFFNSEIVGRSTDLPWGVVFQRLGEDFARHPSQIYEALLAWAIFGVMMFLYLRKSGVPLSGTAIGMDLARAGSKREPILFLFLFMGLYFMTRFLVEFVKEYPTWGFLNLTTGQYLSVVPILIAVGWLFIKYQKRH